MRILFFLFLPIFSFSQHKFKLKPDVYDTTYKNGYLVTIDSETHSCYVKPIIKMQINVSREVPCSTLYIWQKMDSSNVGIYHTENKYDSTQNYGPCGFLGVYSAYTSEYKGDTVINYNCTSFLYSEFKYNLYIPDKTKKHSLGKKYELKKDEYYGGKDTWRTEPTFFICM